MRAQDIPEFVADGAADAGVTGWDLVLRVGRAPRCAARPRVRPLPLVVAAREDDGRIATSTARRSRRRARASPRSSRASRGASSRAPGAPSRSSRSRAPSEIAPHLGIADVIVDLASTGSTLQVNGLREVATVLESSARLVAAPGAVRRRRRRPDASARARRAGRRRSASVLRARGKRYVMANVPRAALDEVKRVAPRPQRPDGDRHHERRRHASPCTRWWPRRRSTAPSPSSRRWAARGSSSPASRG